jgi:pimeloyl-ACP methyl ester carboxylesterase
MAGARLIFLHAFPLDPRMWDAQVGVLAAPATAPRLYPLGDSMAAWAGRVLEAAGDEPLVLVGCSMGGSCALEMARLAGDRIAALVLIGTKAAHRPEPDLRDRYVAMLRDGGMARIWPELAPRFFGLEGDPAAMAAAEAIALAQNSEDLVRAVRVFHGRPDATEVVAAWHKPLLVIGGDQDGFVSARRAAALAASAPHGRFHLMRGCGHLPNLERSAEFNAVLDAFVRATLKG